MARKRETGAEVAITDSGQVLDLTGLETADELNPALQRLYAEMGNDVLGKIKVYIYKIIPETGKEPRIWEGVPDDYDLTAMAKRFGSGDYRVKVYAPHESGRIVVAANTVFPMLLDPAEDARIAVMRDGTALPQQLPGAQPALTAEAIAAIVAQAVKVAMPAQVDTLAQMDRLASVMAKLMPQQAPVQTGGGFMETLKAATSLMELSRSMNPPVDGEGRTDVKGHALAKGIDVLTRMFEKGLEQAQQNPAHHPAKPNGGALPAPDAQQAHGAESELTQDQLEELEMLRVQIKMVNRQARANADTDKLAEDFYEDLPDQVFDLIVFESKWFEVLCANVPECAQHKEWYEKMRASIIAKGIKDGDLKAQPDGSLTFVEEPPHGNTDAGNVAATSG